MSYFREFFTNWRSLASASIGIASGYAVNNYLQNIFIPSLMEEFGWKSSTIALLGITAIVSVIAQPLVGRATDKFGIRPVALFGVASGTLIYVGFSMMTGSFLTFFVLNLALLILVASATGPAVYSKMIAENYCRARGMALAIAASSPAVAGALLVPFLSSHIEVFGWRSGYQMVALCTAAGGLLAIYMIPLKKQDEKPTFLLNAKTSQGIKSLATNPASALIVTGTVLCSLTIVMQTTQLKVILLNNGLTSSSASLMVSIYAAGVLCGRLVCGAALDRFPSHIVASISLGLPGVGLILLALGTSSYTVTAISVLLLGLALGAEADIGGYLAMTFFKLEVYSTVVGFFIGSMAFASVIGSLILSLSLSITDSFKFFLLLSAVCAFMGSFLFWRLKYISKKPNEEVIFNDSDFKISLTDH